MKRGDQEILFLWIRVSDPLPRERIEAPILRAVKGEEEGMWAGNIAPIGRG